MLPHVSNRSIILNTCKKLLERMIVLNKQKELRILCFDHRNLHPLISKISNKLPARKRTGYYHLHRNEDTTKNKEVFEIVMKDDYITSENIVDILSLMKKDFSINNSPDSAKKLLKKSGIIDANGKLAEVYR